MVATIKGQKLGGRYRVLSRVGGGGMASVYKAKDALLGRFVAIKVLNESLSGDVEFIRRFSREAQAAASLSHPNIVSVYDVGSEGYRHYIVMELVEGPTLKEYVAQRAPLSFAEFANIIIQICDALANAHENTIIHRDIKPHNILLGFNGRVKVTDFGIARAASSATITRAGSIMGSVHYFSPEQARGGLIDEKSDIYSLGIIMYEMLTGQLPFTGDSAISIALKHLSDIPVVLQDINPHVTDELAAIVMKSLDKDADKRYNNVMELADAIRAVIKLEPTIKASWRDFKLPVAVAVENIHVSSWVAEDSSQDQEAFRWQDVAKKGKFSFIKAWRCLKNKLIRDKDRVEEKTLLQRTAAWIDGKQISWWQKVLFAIATVGLTLSLAVGGFIICWPWLYKHSASSEKVAMAKFSTVQEARDWLKNNHFAGDPNIVVTNNSYYTDTQVIEQKPKAGVDVSRDTPITLYVGQADEEAAPSEVIVKDYTTWYESRVLAEEHDLGYKVEVVWSNDDEATAVNEHQAYKQEPAAGTKIQRGETVKVYFRTSSVPKGEQRVRK